MGSQEGAAHIFSLASTCNSIPRLALPFHFLPFKCSRPRRSLRKLLYLPEFAFCEIEKLGILKFLSLYRPAKLRHWVLFAALAILASGCKNYLPNVMFHTPKALYKTHKPFIHLNGDSTSTSGYEHRIQVDDEIAIRFLNNLDIAEGLTMSNTGGPTGVTFLVNREGDIDLPMVGKLKVVGMTKQETKEAIEEKYSVTYRDPKVEITIQNLSVAVQGEVKAPGIYKLGRERTSLVEVLSAAGGITQFSKRHLVKVVRGAGLKEQPEILIFDLRQIDAIRTEDLYLRDKDIVYVVPRDIRVFADAVTPYTSFLTILSAVGTLSVVVLNLSRRP
jgi:polysaccharide export outer membrane protein